MTSLNNFSLNSGPRGTISSAFPSGPSMGGMGAMGPVSNGFNSPMGFQTGGMGIGMRPTNPALYGGMAAPTNTPSFGALTQNQNQPGKPTNMSALDSLFTQNKPRVSMNQMAPKPSPGTTAPTPWLNQFGTGQPSQTAPAQVAPMGMQGGFGAQANPFFNPQNFSQPVAAPAMMKQSAPVNNDLKDLFG